MTQHDLVDVGSSNPGIGQRFARDAHDQALNRLSFEAAEWGMRPADDASSHGNLLLFRPRRRFGGIV
jgi:hypothetical protein